MFNAINPRLLRIEQLLESLLQRLKRLEERAAAIEQGSKGTVGAFSDGSTILVKSPGGGVPARNGTTGAYGSATCTLYDDDGTKVTLSATTLTVYNKTAVAFGPTKDLFCRVEGGIAFAVQELCP
jgi:hypothetical protein